MKTADQTTIEQPSRDWTINRFCSETGIPYNSLKDRLTRSGHAPERGSRFTLRELIDALRNPVDIDAEKLRKLTAEADLSEIERDMKRGQLVELDTVQADFARWAHRIRSVIERHVSDETARTEIFRAIRKPLNADVKAD